MDEQGKKEASGRISFHYGKAKFLDETVRVVERFLASDKLVTQIVKEGNTVVVQAKRKASLARKAFGLDQAVSVQLVADGEDLKATVGGAKWIDKAAGATIGIFVFAPTLLTAGWGTYKQQKLFGRIEKEIASFFDSKG